MLRGRVSAVLPHGISSIPKHFRPAELADVSARVGFVLRMNAPTPSLGRTFHAAQGAAPASAAPSTAGTMECAGTSRDLLFFFKII